MTSPKRQHQGRSSAPRGRTLPRVTRSHAQEVPHEESAWAISYADLLLVLLAFFVIFSSFDETEDKDAALLKLAQNLSSSGAFQNAGGSGTQGGNSGSNINIGYGSGSGNGAGSSSGQGNGAGSGGRGPSGSTGVVDYHRTLFQGLGSLASIELAELDQKLVLQFQNDIFPKGQFSLPTDLQEDLLQIYTSLKDQKQNIHITLVGHADRSRLRSRKNPVLNDNFDLSAIRALQALKVLRGLGFPEEQMSIKASSFHERDVRSLSMEIKWVTL